MKRFATILSISIFLFSTLSGSEKTDDIAALSIGELSLSYRLLSLTASLAISNAADKNSIKDILENTIQTLEDCERVIAPAAKKEKLIGEISRTAKKAVSCSKTISLYTENKNRHNLGLVQSCMDDLAKRIDTISQMFNKRSKQKKKGD